MAQRKNADNSSQLMNVVIIVLGGWAIWEWIINPWIQQHQASTTCYDVHGNAIQCPAGYSAGQTVGTVTVTQTTTPTVPVQQPQPTPPTPTPTTNNYLIARMAAEQARMLNPLGIAARRGATVTSTTTNADGSLTVTTSDGTRTTITGGSQSTARTGVGGITPSWPAGGGPAFNHFIPGGGMTFGGANAFGSPAYGVMESLPKHGWIQ